MFLRCTKRKKDGKEHEYWSIVENKRVRSGKVLQRHVLYLGEINSTQAESWRRTIELFEDGKVHPRTVSIFPEDRFEELKDEDIVRIRVKDMQLHRPRQWGACWLGCLLYDQLKLNEFWKNRLPQNRKGTRWDAILKLLVIYRLIAPGSEWQLHRQWFEQSAMGDLLGGDFELAEIHKLYSCLDHIVKHKEALFSHLTERWKDMFNTKFDVLLYDLTSTYFESDTHFPEEDKRKYGYSRDKRSDCVQVVIALVVTTEGLPIAYEVLAGNTSDKTTLKDFLRKIENQYGKAERIWVMDRGIPTDEILEEMRNSEPKISYLVGTPKGRLTKLEKELTDLTWKKVREGVRVKLLPQEGELYVFAESKNRISKERSMRKRQLKILWKQLIKLKNMRLSRDALLIKLGSAKQQSPSAWRLVNIEVSEKNDSDQYTFSFFLNKNKLRDVRRREGRYLLRTNITNRDPETLWKFYIQLTHVEQAFKDLKGDLSIRPIFHQKMERIEAHIFISFLAYCLQITLSCRLRSLAEGLTARTVIEKFSSIQMLDVIFPTTDGRQIMLSRYTEPNRDLQILLEQLQLRLPAQPPPKISTFHSNFSNSVVKTFH